MTDEDIRILIHFMLDEPKTFELIFDSFKKIMINSPDNPELRVNRDQIQTILIKGVLCKPPYFGIIRGIDHYLFE